MKRFVNILIGFLAAGLSVKSQPGGESMRKLIDDNLRFASKQYRLLEKNTPDSLMPRYFDPGKNQLFFSDTKWWCSGFFPGTLLLILLFASIFSTFSLEATN